MRNRLMRYTAVVAAVTALGIATPLLAQTTQFASCLQPNATLGTAGGRVCSGAGDPEGALVGWVGDVYLRRDGGAGETVYVKESGAGTNTGWQVVPGGLSIPVPATQGGTGQTSYTVGEVLYADTTTSLAKRALLVPGTGNAALAWASATTVDLVERDTGADPSADTPVVLTVGGQERIVTAAQAVVLPTDLDTGAEAAGTTYYVWATRDGLDTGIDLKFSASKTAPTGLTTKLLLGAVHNSPSSDLIANSAWSLSRGERDRDGMVKVGDQWVDIYEASVWTTITGGTQKGASSDDYGCADTGNDCSGLYARSVYNVTPSRYLSWFQAARFCAASGKHLILDAEWQTQALGTPEVANKAVTSITRVLQVAHLTTTAPHGWVTGQQVIVGGGDQSEYRGAYTITVIDDDEFEYTIVGTPATPGTGTFTLQERDDCIVGASTPFGTGTATSCQSWAGTYDSVGNLWEWTGNWWAGTRASASPAAETPGTTTTWGPGLIDTLWNIRGAAYADGNGSGYKDNMPAAVFRGGNWFTGATAGVFSLNLSSSPWNVDSVIGFRCAGR